MPCKKKTLSYLNNNPFTAQIYNEVWSKCYFYEKQLYKFNSLYPLSFVKSKIPFTYLNAGKNLTSGIYYHVNENKNDFKKKVFFIRDVPSYYGLSNEKKFNSNLKLKFTKQYNGFLADIQNYESVDDYLKSLVSKNRVRYYKKCLRKLKENYNINFKVYYGNISKTEHQIILHHYDKLMCKRYHAKGEKIIGDSEQSRDFFKKLSFALINDKKAMLKVLYDETNPIGVLFSYTSDKVVYASRIVFDIAYSDFGIGHILLYKELEWAFTNNFSFVDFTKVEYSYKYKWCNHKYTYDYHFLYDSNHLASVIIAHTMLNFFRFLQFLRNYNVHILFHKILFNFTAFKNILSKK